VGVGAGVLRGVALPSCTAPAMPLGSERTRNLQQGIQDVPPPGRNGVPRRLAQQGYDPSVRPIVNSGSQPTSNQESRRIEAEEDRDLIRRAQQGDRGAFAQLVERHQRRAFVLALGLVRDENDAREIVQEAFVRVFRGLDSFKGTSSFFTWLYRIVTNLSIDLMRKPSRRDSELVEPATLDDAFETPFLARIDGADPLDAVQRSDVATAIQAALDALPPYHRGVIVMREVEGMSYEEMAEVMGVSKGTIMSRLFHARQKLQRALAGCYEDHFGRAPDKGRAP
jgi:RNA polymerase sigma-70 factor, ECF subfamily